MLSRASNLYRLVFFPRKTNTSISLYSSSSSQGGDGSSLREYSQNVSDEKRKNYRDNNRAPTQNHQNEATNNYKNNSYKNNSNRYYDQKNSSESHNRNNNSNNNSNNNWRPSSTNYNNRSFQQQERQKASSTNYHKIDEKKKNDQNKVDYYLKSEFKTTLNNFKEENQTTKLVNFSSFNHFFLVLNLNSLIAVLNNMKIVKSSKFV